MHVDDRFFLFRSQVRLRCGSAIQLCSTKGGSLSLKAQSEALPMSLDVLAQCWFVDYEATHEQNLIALPVTVHSTCVPKDSVPKILCRVVVAWQASLVEVEQLHSHLPGGFKIITPDSRDLMITRSKHQHDQSALFQDLCLLHTPLGLFVQTFPPEKSWKLLHRKHPFDEIRQCRALLPKSRGSLARRFVGNNACMRRWC